MIPGAGNPTLPTLVRDGRVARVVLRDPARRNAFDEPALRALVAVLRETHALCEAGDGVDVVVLAGEGAAFSSGFDLALCAEEPRRVEPLLSLLSDCVRALRSMPAPVVARVQGAALAGGCALLTGCDFVVVAPDAQLGYPVHRIGISPAVSVPSLLSRMGPGARALMLSGEILDGVRAHAEGLATHLAAGRAARDPNRGESHGESHGESQGERHGEKPRANADGKVDGKVDVKVDLKIDGNVDEHPDRHLDAEVDALVARLLAKGPQALRATKAWIARVEELGAGDLGRAPARDGASFGAARDASIALAAGDEFATMLRAFWASRRGAR